MSDLRLTAIHEAGHAVFMWRGGELVYGDAFNDRLAPFSEIVLNDQEPDAHGRLPAMQLAEGWTHEAAGSVIAGFRMSVPSIRKIEGIRPADRRRMIGYAKREAQALLIGTLAGPLVEEQFIATNEGRKRYFDWSEELDLENDDGYVGDVTKAFAIAERELCRGWRKARATMDNAVAHIGERLDHDDRYMRAVTSLADALEARLRIDVDAAVDVMRQAWSGGAPLTNQEKGVKR